MPDQWCANTSNRPNKSKIVCKPTHPDVQRRIGRVLAAFLGRKFSVLFEKHEYSCSTCYLSAKHEYEDASIRSVSDSMDTDDFRSARASAFTAASNISSIAGTDVTDSGSESSSSMAFEKDVAKVISAVERKEATSLLNDVLPVLGQRPIIDIRNRYIVRQQVDGALVLIRKTAESIFCQDENEDEDENEEEDDELLVQNSRVSDVTMTEADELVANFKYLVSSSDYSEQIRILTLAPKAWGRLNIENFFRCSQHQVRYGVLL
jgi:hypothetical protein